ncbi:hypothetical protein B0H16DRAFT_1482174 [Mycena metata]|uniref:Uncharacterized protein n=1 Tax=Mycena metata TaxID=1033252 RepID=A0AAD7M8M5_9AGAR|nr:hypothetical protein B0H16DRAFT_1482174 [Mycena metata]
MSARKGAAQALAGVDTAWGRAYEESYNVGREGVVRWGTRGFGAMRVGGTRGAALIGFGVQEGGRSSTPLKARLTLGRWGREGGERASWETVGGSSERERQFRGGIVALELVLTSAREGGVREEREAAGGGIYGCGSGCVLRDAGCGRHAEGWVGTGCGRVPVALVVVSRGGRLRESRMPSCSGPRATDRRFTSPSTVHRTTLTSPGHQEFKGIPWKVKENLQECFSCQSNRYPIDAKIEQHHYPLGKTEATAVKKLLGKTLKCLRSNSNPKTRHKGVGEGSWSQRSNEFYASLGQIWPTINQEPESCEELWAGRNLTLSPIVFAQTFQFRIDIRRHPRKLLSQKKEAKINLMRIERNDCAKKLALLECRGFLLMTLQAA